MFFTLLFAASLAFDVWITRKLVEEGRLPTWFDRAGAILVGLVGVVLFISVPDFTNKPVESALNLVIGTAAIAVFIWMLTVYKNLERNHRGY